jgi:solute carrier family 45, member 1/2/4
VCEIYAAFFIKLTLFRSAWIGWFPVLFFLSTYIGEMHRRASPSATDAEGVRLGGRTQFYSAIVSLITNIALPFFVVTSESRAGSSGNGFYEVKKKSIKDRIPKVHLATLWAVSHAIFALCMAATWYAYCLFIDLFD